MSHTSNIICPRFLNGSCPMSFLCKFSHRKENAPLCGLWVKGLCVGAAGDAGREKGNACKFRHYYNEMDASMQAAKRQTQVRTSTVKSQLVKSPKITVKIVKEVLKQRKVEVDLETGKRKSWVETTEVEVLDLTEATPAKKTILVTPLTIKENNVDFDAGYSEKSSLTVQKSPETEVRSGTCPMCFQKFKGEKGVLSHRRARNSTCHPNKENQTSSKELENQPATQNFCNSPAAIRQNKARKQGITVSRTSATIIENLAKTQTPKLQSQKRKGSRRNK